MNRGRSWRAPRDDGGLLIEPPWPELVALVDQNRIGPHVSQFTALRDEARRELVADALSYTRQYRDVSLGSEFRVPSSGLVLAGHQPELFHAGVWAKNFALARVAAETKAVAVNLIIDGDTLKSASLRVPTGTPDEPRIESVPFDAPGDEIPFEERSVLDGAQFESFGRRAVEMLAPLVPEPLLRSFWPTVVEEAARTNRIGAAFARARHRLEGAWGLQTLEYPQSRMCETRSFARFVAPLLDNLPDFHRAHNTALAEYRRVENIRSANHPVPELTQNDGWFEAPLWIWTTADPRRRRLFARRDKGRLLLTDRQKLEWELSFAADGGLEPTVEALVDLRTQGVRLRSRALLTTMYARLILGDLFLHGIGGGKYDQLTDEIVRRYFHCEPPAFGVVTATRHLPMSVPPRLEPPTADVEQRLWELTHHPERRLDLGALTPDAARDATRWIEEKRHWTAVESTRNNGRRRCQAIRAANAALQPYVAELRRTDEELLTSARSRDRIDGVSGNREFSCFFFPEKDLRDFMLAIPAPTR